MTIVYSSLARGPTLLCSHTESSSNFDNMVVRMLPNIPTRQNARTTYTSDNFYFHVAVANGIIYLCACETDDGKRQPYAFLTEVQRQLTTGPAAHRVQFADERELQSDFAPVLAAQMNKFNAAGGRGGDQLSVLQSQVDEVRDVMTQNIEKVLQRGENLETLMERSTDLEAHSNTFMKTSRQVHRKFFWKNMKMTIILVVVGLVILLALILIILFSTGVLPVDNSSGNDSPATTTTTTTSSP